MKQAAERAGITAAQSGASKGGDHEADRPRSSSVVQAGFHSQVPSRFSDDSWHKKTDEDDTKTNKGAYSTPSITTSKVVNCHIVMFFLHGR
jgi:hypothetical protein